MHRCTIFLALGLAAVGTADGAWAGTEEAFMCRHQGRERRVELQRADGADQLPCEVVYWRDVSRGGDGQSIWEAQNDFGFCIERTRDLLQRLEDGGWSCQKVAPEGRGVATIPALAPTSVDAMPDADRSRLDQALARDLRRLAQLSSGKARFELIGAQLGDLDQDGDDDAAVILDYLSDGPETAQFLMAYRFDGETFRPAAKTYLGRLGGAARAAGIERIDEGVIEVLLQVHQQGDQECCPSGRHRQTYVLQNGDLLELRPGS